MMVVDVVLPIATSRATGKTVRENLIENLFSHPLRACIRAIKGEKRQLGWRKGAKACWRKPLLAVIPQQFKGVTTARLAFMQTNFRAPLYDIVARRFATAAHRHRHLFVIDFRAHRHPLRQVIAAKPQRDNEFVLLLFNKGSNRKVPGVQHHLSPILKVSPPCHTTIAPYSSFVLFCREEDGGGG